MPAHDEDDADDESNGKDIPALGYDPPQNQILRHSLHTHDGRGTNIPAADELTYREAADLLFGWREFYESSAREPEDEWLVTRITELALRLDTKARMLSINRERRQRDPTD